jgi:hypothetical protein
MTKFFDMNSRHVALQKDALLNAIVFYIPVTGFNYITIHQCAQFCYKEND